MEDSAALRGVVLGECGRVMAFVMRQLQRMNAAFATFIDAHGARYQDGKNHISFLILYKMTFLTKIRNTMSKKLTALGQKIRSQRKALRITATATAEAAGMSRVTLYRIEKGEASVTIGAYLNAMAALGLDFDITPTDSPAAHP